jgi:hypothetical protein
MLPTREFLIANLGPGGGVWRLDRDWRLFPHLFEADSELLRVCNFVAGHRMDLRVDPHPANDRSARSMPMALSCATIEAAAHIVADGLGFSNECRRRSDGAGCT